MRVGDVVRAVGVVEEWAFDGRHVMWTHAEAGDVGRVVDVSGEWVMVAWRRSTAQVHETEVVAALSLRAGSAELAQAS